MSKPYIENSVEMMHDILIENESLQIIDASICMFGFSKMKFEYFYDLVIALIS